MLCEMAIVRKYCPTKCNDEILMRMILLSIRNRERYQTRIHL